MPLFATLLTITKPSMLPASGEPLAPHKRGLKPSGLAVAFPRTPLGPGSGYWKLPRNHYYSLGSLMDIAWL